MLCSIGGARESTVDRKRFKDCELLSARSRANAVPRARYKKGNGASGRGGFGNMRYGMTWITDITRMLHSKLVVLYHRRDAIDVSERVRVLRGLHLARYRHRDHPFLREDNAF